MRRPVVPLLRAMYGHPDSGTYWEEHCNDAVESKGFVAIIKSSWPGTYFHPRLRLMLVIYVDDLELAGPASNMAEGWAMLWGVLNIDGPLPVDLFLGMPARSPVWGGG